MNLVMVMVMVLLELSVMELVLWLKALKARQEVMRG